MEVRFKGPGVFALLSSLGHDGGGENCWRLHLDRWRDIAVQCKDGIPNEVALDLGEWDCIALVHTINPYLPGAEQALAAVLAAWASMISPSPEGDLGAPGELWR